MQECERLKSCPFCGFIPDAENANCIYPLDRERKEWILECYEIEGGCGANVLGDSAQDAINKWNKRSSPKWEKLPEPNIVYPDDD